MAAGGGYFLGKGKIFINETCVGSCDWFDVCPQTVTLPSDYHNRLAAEIHRVINSKRPSKQCQCKKLQRYARWAL